MGLSSKEVLALLQVDDKPRPVQIGPLHFMEGSDRCGSRGCGSPTHYQICGVWYCGVHALDLLNRMVVILASGKGWHKSFLAAKEQITKERDLTTDRERDRVSA